MADEVSFYLTGASSDGGVQTDPNASLGNFRSNTKVASSNNITAPINVTGVTIDEVSLAHDSKPVSGTLVSQGNTVKKASLTAPIGAAIWRPSGTVVPKLLLNMGLVAVEDESGNGHVVTHLGGAVTAKKTSPFAEGSALVLNGSTQLLTVANHTDFDPGIGDFTAEGFVKTSIGTSQGMIGNKPSSGATQNGFNISVTSSGIRFIKTVSNNTVDLDFSGTIDITDNLYHHFAIVRKGNTFFIFADGILDNSTTNSTTISATTQHLAIGANPDLLNSTYTLHFNGNITGVQFTDVAKYTSNFTPITTQDTGIGLRKLLLNMDGNDGDTTFVDESPSSHSVVAGGNAQVDTDILSPFNDSTLILDGIDDYLQIAHHPDFDLADRDFTVRFKARKTDAPAGSDTLFSRNSNATDRAIIFRHSGAAILRLQIFSSGGVFEFSADSVNGLPQDIWTDVELSRSDDHWRLFLDGVQEFDVEDNAVINSASVAFSIGTQFNGAIAIAEWKGNMDFFEVHKGIALHKSDFTPPTNKNYHLEQKIDFQANGESVRTNAFGLNEVDRLAMSSEELSFLTVDTGNGAFEPDNQNITINNAIGVLAYTNTGQTLAYTAPGDSVGTPVAVGAGGTFTIRSKDVSLFLVVTVVAGSLPGSDQSDNLTISRSGVIDNLFDTVQAAEAVSGDIEYRALILKNDTAKTFFNFKIFLDRDTPNTQDDVSIAIEELVGDKIQTIADEQTAPTGLTFAKPSRLAPLTISGFNLTASSKIGLWMKRSISSGGKRVFLNNFQIGVKFSVV